MLVSRLYTRSIHHPPRVHERTAGPTDSKCRTSGRVRRRNWVHRRLCVAVSLPHPDSRRQFEKLHRAGSLMKTAVRRGAVIILLVFSAACGGSGPTSPTGMSQPPTPAPAPPPPVTSPPLSGPSRTFIFDRELSDPVREYTKTSRFVLYDNGAFVLQYVSLAAEYRGGYTEVNGVIAFDFGNPWRATGTLNGDSLTIEYNLLMAFSDFEEAVYVVMR